MSISSRRFLRASKTHSQPGIVPGAVTNLRVAYKQGDTVARVMFEPASSGGTPTSYRLARDDGGGVEAGPWSTVDPVNLLYRDFTYLQPNATYTFSVIPFNAAGDGPTGTVSVTTTAQKLFNESTQTLLARKHTWAHMIPHGLPDVYSDVVTNGVNHYGALYSLDMVKGNYFAPRRATAGVPRAIQAGISGMQILQMGANRGDWMVDDWMNRADPTWTGQPDAVNFVVAPCWQVDSMDVANAIQKVQQYVAYAASRPSAARVNGKYVFYMYAARGFSVAQWQSLRAQLDAQGYQYFFIADFGADASQHGQTFYYQNIDPYVTAGVFDAYYMFDDSLHAGTVWGGMVNYIAQKNLVIAGGLMPGYNREFVPPSSVGGFMDAQNTKVYRSLLEKYDRSGVYWNNMVTWNDMVEHTDVQATSEWNRTRADLTAFYSARLRGLAYPRPQPELYVTTQKFVKVGGAFTPEAMVINGSADQTVRVTVELFHSSGATIGTTAQAYVYPGSTGDATLSSGTIATSGQVGTWARARARMYDVAGTIIQEVTSAPILIYAASAAPTSPFRRTYYSVPAYAQLPNNAQPTLTIGGSPTTGSRTATVTAPAGTQVRFNEVLQNTRQVENGFTLNPFQTTVPMTQRYVMNGQPYNATAAGFYVGRTIDEQERVGYSDPLYFA